MKITVFFLPSSPKKFIFRLPNISIEISVNDRLPAGNHSTFVAQSIEMVDLLLFP